jgi:glucosamine--fructose-6-phosphate aminotransferase (isomerizing)
MCGVFAFFTHGGKPNLDTLARIALVTQTRGRDAFGLAWVDSKGGVGSMKRPGSAADNMDMLDLVADARIIVGHCRFATNGTPADNRNNHPHRAGDGWIVHNGTIPGHREIAKHYGLKLRTACDSELIAKLVEHKPGELSERGEVLLRLLGYDMAVLGCWTDKLLVCRRGKPLSFSSTNRGCYIASLPIGLPGEPRSVKDNWAGCMTLKTAA